ALETGRRYYIEARHKEGYGSNDFISAAWKLPNGVFEKTIPGTSLMPYENISTLPLVSIQEFENNMLTLPVATSITTTVNDPHSQIEKVEFFVDDVKIGEDTTVPFSIKWNSYIPGRYLLTAKATDSSGGSSSDKVNVVVDDPLTQPVLAKLSAYPNPFSEYINLEFTAASTGPTMLQVYNLNGILLETLHNGPAEAGKVYTYKFDGNRYPSGTYMCKFFNGSKVEGKLIILAK
ncbi:MAG: Ig-like domain-containing protein, partial [Sphingobacteriaceae bacterium]